MSDDRTPTPDENLGDAVSTGQSGASGGTLATDIGTRDELGAETDGDDGMTRVRKDDKRQPDTGTRSDHEGASTGE